MTTARIFALPLIGCLLGSIVHAADPVAVTDLEQIRWMFGTWVGSETPVDSDIEGFAAKGDPVASMYTLKETPDSKFVFGDLVLTKGDESLQMFRDVWGHQPASDKLHRWTFFRDGLMFEGTVFVADDRVIHRVEGKARPIGEQLQELAASVGLSELPFAADVVFRRVDEKTMSVVVEKVTVAGLPFPWPGAGKEQVAKRVD